MEGDCTEGSDAVRGREAEAVLSAILLSSSVICRRTQCDGVRTVCERSLVILNPAIPKLGRQHERARRLHAN